MNNEKIIFSQIMSNIPEREFKACTRINHYTQFQRTSGYSFTIKPQLMNYLTILFLRKSQPITICRVYSDRKISKWDSSKMAS